jgi:hypothetical protein
LAVFRGVSQRLAQQEDVLAQVRFLDERIRPDLFEEFFLGDYLAAAAYQDEQRLEGFGCDRNRVVSPEQDLLVGVHVERPEFINNPGVRSHRLKSQRLEEARMHPSPGPVNGMRNLPQSLPPLESSPPIHPQYVVTLCICCLKAPLETP